MEDTLGNIFLSLIEEDATLLAIHLRAAAITTVGKIIGEVRMGLALRTCLCLGDTQNLISKR